MDDSKPDPAPHLLELGDGTILVLSHDQIRNRSVVKPDPDRADRPDLCLSQAMQISGAPFSGYVRTAIR